MQAAEVEIISQNTICFSELKEQEVEWLWYPYIPRGKITIMQGDPGEGKTTLALQIGALLTRGMMYGSDKKQLPGTILVQSAEDGLRDTILPRLRKSGADLTRVRSIREDVLPLTLTDERLAKTLEVYAPDLLIIDPLQAYLGADVDMHRANEVRPVLSNLSELAERTGTTVLLIGHMNKMTGLKAVYKGLGSIDITAAARSVLLVAKNPKEPDTIYMGHVKSSLAPAGPVLGFERTQQGPLQYLGEQSMDVQRLLDSVPRMMPRDTAADFLQEFLKDGKHPVKEVLEAAKEQGISKGTLVRAAKELGVMKIRNGNQHYMALPEDIEPAPEPAPVPEEELAPADFVEIL